MKDVRLLFIPIVFVYILGMFLDVMEIDAAQYAAMSREMMDTGSFLEIFDRGRNYLDKPPLLFWLSALSFKAFGISNFSYKLPSILFSLLGIWATYRLGRSLYGKKTGAYAAVILASCQAWFLMNHDVRTDTILAACTITAIWQLYLFLETIKLSHLIYGALAIAGAMLTKGPIGFMVPIIAIGSQILLTRQWHKIFQWQWLLMIVIVGICLIPMCIGLYHQYDLQPGKIIQGVPIDSGLKFFFWTQSFGRITGESVWQDDTTVLFFTHTFLWAFLPWPVLFLRGLWLHTRELIVARFKSARLEVITWAGFIIPFIAFSLSHYKLPHYIFCVFPLAAIITGRYVDRLLSQTDRVKELRIMNGVQFYLSLLLYVLVILLCGPALQIHSPLLWMLVVAGIILSLLFFLRDKNKFDRLVLPSLCGVLVLNLILNVYAYPAIFQYASSPRAARMIESVNGLDRLAGYRYESYALDFYAKRIVPDFGSIDELKEQKGKFTWILTERAGRDEIRTSGIPVAEEIRLDHFHVSTVNAVFLNPETRSKELSDRFLLRLAK